MHILLIRPGALGDTLLTFPIIEALRAITPAPHVTLVGNRAVMPLARACGLAEETEDYEAPRWSGLFATPPAQNLALHRSLSKFERAIAWLHDPDTLVYRNLQAAGIAQVTVAPGRPAEQKRTHIVEYLASTIDVSIDAQPYYGACFPVHDSQPGAGHRLAIHPGSGGARKCWPVEHFAAVIRLLWERGQPILLLGGPADHERLEALLKLLPVSPQSPFLELLVDVPLLDLAPILLQCRGYIGNDAGITHLAAMLGLSTLALFGPTDPLAWHPCGRSVSILYKPDLAQLQVEAVMARIDTFFYEQGSTRSFG